MDDKWISVKDRMPEEYDEYGEGSSDKILLYDIYGMIYIGYYEFEPEFRYVGWTLEEWNFKNHSPEIPFEITHWMPLPEGPTS